MKITSTNAISTLKSLKEQAANIDNYRESFFEDERGAAEYDTKELINELLSMEIEEDTATQNKSVAGTLKLELTEREAKLLSACLQDSLFKVRGIVAIGVGNPATERAIVRIIKKIAKEQGYESV